MPESLHTALISTEYCGSDVVISKFERPAGYHYLAGQWLRLSLPTPTGDEVRTFTHASAPGDEWIEIATRLSDSAFKQALAALSPGDPATITGSGGRLLLPEGTRRVVFLVGGVGITPARSILRSAVQEGAHFEDAVVFYGNRDPSCVPYREELGFMSSIGVRVIDVFEHAPQNTAAEKGFITSDIVRRNLGDEFSGPYVVAGPPPMVVAMVSVLDTLAVPPQERMIEWFGAPPRT